jgi:hypothetical protein
LLLLETVGNISLLSTILQLYSEIAGPRKTFGRGHMYIYIFFFRMTYNLTSQNIDLSSWDILYTCRSGSDTRSPIMTSNIEKVQNARFRKFF